MINSTKVRNHMVSFLNLKTNLKDSVLILEYDEDEEFE